MNSKVILSESCQITLLGSLKGINSSHFSMVQGLLLHFCMVFRANDLPLAYEI